MEFLPRLRMPDEVDQEVTQRNQFNTENVGLVETLVREAHQNSMDGRLQPHDCPVRTRIRIVESDAAYASFWSSLLEPLRPHLEASGIALNDIDLTRPRLLLIEDFGTTGLLGAVDRRDDLNFSDFWRRTGRSHKHGIQGGRWGLGKLVFSSSSRLRTFFGLTIRDDDPDHTPYLMGQAVLRTHALPSAPEDEYAPHAFFAVRSPSGLQVPERNPAYIETFCQATSITRTTESGLSIAIPFVQPDITTEQMLPCLIRNWFFPILTGSLEVEVGEVTLTRENFADHARAYGGSDFADGRRVAFIKELHTARATAPALTLAANWAKEGRASVEEAVSSTELESLREAYAAGRLVAVRAPLHIRPQTGSLEPTYVDLYLQAAPELARGEAFYVRGAITIPGEAKRFRGRNCFGALIASHPVVVAFLGDAEGPAHTSWSGTAEQLRDNWKAPSDRLREIRDALNWLYLAVANVADQVDQSALLNVFNVPQSGTSKTPRRRRDPIVIDRPVQPIPRKPTPFSLDERKGGFVLKGNAHSEAPMTLGVRTAYDIIEGNALAQYSELDFDLLAGKEIAITASGAAVKPVGANELEVTVQAKDFAVTISGFDMNRDLYVDVQRAQ